MLGSNDATNFKKVLDLAIQTQLKKAGVATYVSAIIKGIALDGTYSVYLPPDNVNSVTGLLNKTGEELNVGDSVELCTKNGKLNNAWIAIKHMTNNSGGSGAIEDVKVNGTSVVENKNANILLKTINGIPIVGAGDVDVGTAKNMYNTSSTDFYSCNYMNESLLNVCKSYVLYDNASGSNGTITLSENITDFSYLEIYYRTTDDRYNMTKVKAANGLMFTLEVSLQGVNNVWINWSDCSLTTNTIQRYDGKIIRFDSNATIAYLNTANNLYIVKVIGYKQ